MTIVSEYQALLGQVEQSDELFSISKVQFYNITVLERVVSFCH